MNRDLENLDRLLKALADPTRLRIVGLLRSGEVCVCHIHESLKITQPKASRHLAYLRRANVVRTDKRGLWVYYGLAEQLNPAAQRVLDQACDAIADVREAKADAARLESKLGCCVPAISRSAAATAIRKS